MSPAINPLIVTAASASSSAIIEALLLIVGTTKNVIRMNNREMTQEQVLNELKVNGIRAAGSTLGVTGAVSAAVVTGLILSPIGLLVMSTAGAVTGGLIAKNLIVGNTSESEENLSVIMKIKYDLVDSSKVMKVEFKNENSSDTDWVGLYRYQESNHRQYITFKRISVHSSKLVFQPLENIHGIFEFRYFKKGSYVMCGKSSTFICGPQVTLTAELIDTEKPYIKVICKYTQGTPDSGDWIALYNMEKNESQYINKYEYIPATDEKLEFEFEFDLPRDGTQCIQAQFCSSKSQSHPLAISGPVFLPNRIITQVTELESSYIVTINWKLYSITQNPKDWIGLFSITDGNKDKVEGNGVQYRFVNDGNVQFDIMKSRIQSGLYVFCYMQSRQYDVIARSDCIILDNRPIYEEDFVPFYKYLIFVVTSRCLGNHFEIY